MTKKKNSPKAMPKWKVEIARLRKLAAFLRKLPAKKFYFPTVVRKYDDKTGCGTVCCAIGWTPAIFPTMLRWYMPGFGHFVLLETKEIITLHGVCTEVFGMRDDRLINILFAPFNCPEEVEIAGQTYQQLGYNAKPTQVARNIDKYIAYRVEAGAHYKC